MIAPAFPIGYMFCDWTTDLKRRLFTVVDIRSTENDRLGLVYLYVIECEGLAFTLNEFELKRKVKR